jgi:type IV pilus assembly protein PilQ
MTNQIQSVRGRVMRHASRYILMGLLVAGVTWTSAALAATATLKNISYEALPGGSVELHMDFGDGAVPQPKIFTTGTPPRIAVDFADTDNAAARHLDIDKGSTSGVSAVSAGGRTRVVVELTRESSYRSRIDGHSLVLTVNNGSADQSVTTAATNDPTKILPSSSAGPAISNIDFRRGPNGEGRVLISFSGSGADAEIMCWSPSITRTCRRTWRSVWIRSTSLHRFSRSSRAPAREAARAWTLR